MCDGEGDFTCTCSSTSQPAKGERKHSEECGDRRDALLRGVPAGCGRRHALPLIWGTSVDADVSEGTSAVCMMSELRKQVLLV